MKIAYSKLYVHFIMTTKFRKPLIPEKYRERIEKYITGIIKNYSSRLYSIHLNPEHLHFVISKSADISENSIVAIVAESSAKFINKNKLSFEFFEWQDTAAVFTVSRTDVDMICKYILNQKAHHAKPTYEEDYFNFVKGYEDMLNKFSSGR